MLKDLADRDQPKFGSLLNPAPTPLTPTSPAPTHDPDYKHLREKFADTEDVELRNLIALRTQMDNAAEREQREAEAKYQAERQASRDRAAQAAAEDAARRARLAAQPASEIAAQIADWIENPPKENYSGSRIAVGSRMCVLN